VAIELTTSSAPNFVAFHGVFRFLWFYGFDKFFKNIFKWFLGSFYIGKNIKKNFFFDKSKYKCMPSRAT
jgi:hypothetical protein